MTKRSMARFAVCLLVLVIVSLVPSGALQSDKPKNVCKAVHLGPMSVAITCLNGADPTGNKYGDTLIISCGKH